MTVLALPAFGEWEVPHYQIEVGESREIEVRLVSAMTGYFAVSGRPDVLYVYGSDDLAGPQACALVRGLSPGVAEIYVPLPIMGRARGSTQGAVVEVVEGTTDRPNVEMTRRRATASRALLSSFDKVLFVAAHPDDELLAAPLLGALCLRSRASCALLSVTEGELGCDDPESCSQIRRDELQKSASFLNLEATTWSWPDGGGCVASSSGCGWEDQAGGRDVLVAQLRNFIEQSGADLVLTLDPRHGSTCHPDHRAIGALTIEAVREMESPPQLWLNETVLSGGDVGSFKFRSFGDDRSFIPVRADLSVGCSLSGWELVHQVARRHKSQFGEQERAALRQIETNGFVSFSWRVLTPDFTWPLVNNCPFAF